MNILIITRFGCWNRLMKKYFRGQGQTVSEVTESIEAVKWLEANPCDAVLLCVEMEMIDEQSLTSLIRANHPNVRVVAATCLGDQSFIDKAAHDGAEGFIKKGENCETTYKQFVRIVTSERVAQPV